MPCPRTEDLCALIDQALPHASATALHHHLQTCPVCAQQLQSLRNLHESLQALPSPALDAQFGLRLQGRLPSRTQPRTPTTAPSTRDRQRTRWAGLAGWVPAGLGAGLALGAGVWLGAMLLGAAPAVAPSGATMVRVFDPVPPGGLCAATELCRVTKGMP